MFACILILILIIPVSFLSVTIEGFFTSEELSEMGIRLENPRTLRIL